MVTASRKTGIAATVADGMGCGADTSQGLAGLSANRYDSDTSCTTIIITMLQCYRWQYIHFLSPHLHSLLKPPLQTCPVH